MKKYLLRSVLFAVAMVLGLSAQAAGYTRKLKADISVTGYENGVLYNFLQNDPEVLPTSGDARYREGDVWGLFNFGAGQRTAVVNIALKADQLIIIQPYDGQTLTINRGTYNEALSNSTGFICYEISEAADDITFTLPRYSGAVAAVVMDKKAGLTEVNYTVNYVCGSTQLKSESLKGIPGADPFISKATIEYESSKYSYVSDNAATVGKIAAGNTYTVTYELMAKYTYTAKTSNPEVELMGGTVWADEKAKVTYPIYLLKNDSTVSTKPAISNEYNYYETLTQNKEIILPYTNTDIKRVAFLAEAEDIEGMTVATGSSANIRCSMGKGAYASTDVVITTLRSGKYKMIVSTRGGGERTYGFQFVADGETVYTTANLMGYNQTGTSDEFTINSRTELILKAAGSNNDMIDYILIYKTGDVLSSDPLGYYDHTADLKNNKTYILNIDPICGNNSFAKYTAKYDGTLNIETDNAILKNSYVTAKTFLYDNEEQELIPTEVLGDKMSFKVEKNKTYYVQFASTEYTAFECYVKFTLAAIDDLEDGPYFDVDSLLLEAKVRLMELDEMYNDETREKLGLTEAWSRINDLIAREEIMIAADKENHPNPSLAKLAGHYSRILNIEAAMSSFVVAAENVHPIDLFELYKDVIANINYTQDAIKNLIGDEPLIESLATLWNELLSRINKADDDIKALQAKPNPTDDEIAALDEELNTLANDLEEFLALLNGEATGINAATATQNENAAVYNMAGQKVNTQFKGIVIKNGKKVIIK